MTDVWGIGILLKNTNILKSGRGKNSATALYSETEKHK